MWQLRWSDGHRYAVEFQANEADISSATAVALRQFCEHTARRYHDGKTHQNKISFRGAELHVKIDGGWLYVGDSETHYTFHSQIRNDNEAELEEMFEHLGIMIMMHSANILTAMDNQRRHKATLSNFCMDVVAMLPQRGER